MFMRITPPLGGFPSSIARQPRGCQCQYRTIRLRKAPGEMFQNADRFWHRHYSNCGDIDPWKPAQGCVIYTIVCGISCSTPQQYHNIYQVSCIAPGGQKVRLVFYKTPRLHSERLEASFLRLQNYSASGGVLSHSYGIMAKWYISTIPPIHFIGCHV